MKNFVIKDKKMSKNVTGNLKTRTAVEREREREREVFINHIVNKFFYTQCCHFVNKIYINKYKSRLIRKLEECISLLLFTLYRIILQKHQRTGPEDLNIKLYRLIL